MLKQRARAVSRMQLACDLALTLASLGVAHALRGRILPSLFPEEFAGPLYPFAHYLPLAALIVPIWAAALWASGFYGSRRTLPMRREIIGAARAVFFGTATLAMIVFALQWNDVSRPFLFLFAIIDFVLLAGEKVALRAMARRVRSRGLNFRTVLVAGTGAKALSLARFLEAHPHWGFRVIGYLDDGSHGVMTRDGHWPRLGDLRGLEGVFAREVIDEVIFAVERGRLEDFEDAMLAAERHGVRSHIALDIFPHAISRPVLEELDGAPLLSFTPIPSSPVLLAAKRATDLVFAVALLLATLPIQALAALAIRLSTRGDIYFRQVRCGLNGRPFTLLKFRTMVADAQERLAEVAHLNEMRGPVFKASKDPRLTSVGRWLRRFSIDELPQLWNVLAGHMSLVGPRPPLPEEVARYEPWQRRRLSMKPGLTCLWQVSGRSDTVDFERWMELDLQYIDTWSPWLDLKILARTVPAVLSGKGAR